MAVRSERRIAAVMLIEAGADVNLKDKVSLVHRYGDGAGELIIVSTFAVISGVE